jgi:acetyltransferase
MSHTASLAGNHAVIAGALAQAGVTEARDFKQWMDLCRSLAAAPPAASGKGRIAVLTFSGGAGIMAADFFEDVGLEVADLSEETTAAVQELFPSWMPVATPVDVWPAMEKNMGTGVDVYGTALRSILADPGVDAVLLLAFVGNFRITMDLEDLAAQSRKAGKPVFLWLLGTRDKVTEFQQEARSFGVLAFQELYRAVECLDAVLRRRPPGCDIAEASAAGTGTDRTGNREPDSDARGAWMRRRPSGFSVPGDSNRGRDAGGERGGMPEGSGNDWLSCGTQRSAARPGS